MKAISAVYGGGGARAVSPKATYWELAAKADFYLRSMTQKLGRIHSQRQIVLRRPKIREQNPTEINLFSLNSVQRGRTAYAKH